MSGFPTPHTVGLERFNGTGEDAMGNDVEIWADSVEVKVIAWQSSAVESQYALTGYTSRVESDIDMAIPPTLTVSVRDRVTLPGDTGAYEAIAIEDANHGFHGWQPGSVVKLKRITGG